MKLTQTAAARDDGRASGDVPGRGERPGGQRHAPATLSFFSGGLGTNAHWFATTDQPPDDTDNQAIQLNTTNDAPTFAQGYAGILFHHVTGIPAEAFPDSSFWVRTTNFTGPSLGSPRLIVEFQTAAGTYDGYANLRPLLLTSTWQEVNDQSTYPNSGWDVMDHPCTRCCRSSSSSTRTGSTT